MKRILLTGSSGFLSKNIIKYISDIVYFDGLSRSSSDINIDLSKEVPRFSIKYDLIIHTAGLAHITSINSYQTELFYLTNVIGTINLLKGLEFCKPNKFVFISSVSVYGLQYSEGITEDTELLARDPYGRSKIEAEEVVLKWCNENNVICTILRLPLVVGPNPPGNLGSMIQAIKKGYYFNISGGITRKSMVLASDIAKYIIKASEVGGIYNLTDGDHPTFAELSYCIAGQFGRRYVPNLPKFLTRILAFIGDKVWLKFPFNSDKLSKISSTLTFDDSKARKAFGWNPTSVINGFKISE